MKDIKDYPLGDDDDQVDVEENSLDDSVTPTFYKNKNFVHIGVHIKCISNCSTYEKPSKNKSCIGCIAWHGILYFF
jgi:hypothetical protein